jgi:inosine-uridine nucleoside N-ribohydrolase
MSDSEVLRDVKAASRVLLAALDRQMMRSDVTGKCLYSMNVEDAMRALRRKTALPVRKRAPLDADLTRKAS